ncbi:MAG: bifunctional transcriptional activator/DNA repair protein Ada [Ignavibacteria bacterium]|nr:bifunctional transcriptional activator/DNA repair protein Ada [Ignavibacteria bacterium]
MKQFEEIFNSFIGNELKYDGIYWVGVKTTGIFCRPVCTAKRPKPENVVIFSSIKEALQNGFRACKICKPLSDTNNENKDINLLISKINESPERKFKDYDLRKMGYEPATLRRWFKKNFGLTFHAYQRMNRINTAFKEISNGKTVTDTAFNMGFESLSGFNDSFKKIFGVTPNNSKEITVVNIQRFNTPLGTMIAGATENKLCILEFTDRRMLETELKQLTKLLNAKFIQSSNKVIEKTKKQIEEYFEGKRKNFDIELLTPGSDFQNKVWNSLMEIPYGKTISYKQQSVNMKIPKSVRAVANANGQNRIAIIIPCHRVIGENGKLTGYGGGLWRKERLINLEKKLQ